MKDLTLPTLKPCPFCGAGETQMRENGRVWGGKAYGEPSSVSVVHWCVIDGQPSRVLERVGRDKHSAIEAWNTRAALSSHHEDGGRAESMGVDATKKDLMALAEEAGGARIADNIVQMLPEDLARFCAAMGEVKGLAEMLKDPATVHANMLRGTIAKISMLQCAHTHGEDAVAEYQRLIGLGEVKGEAVADEKLNELLDAYAEIAHQNGVEFCAGNEGNLEGELTAKRAVLALFADPVGKARMLTDEEADHITGMHNTGRSQGDSECAEAIQRKFCEVNGISLAISSGDGGYSYARKITDADRIAMRVAKAAEKLRTFTVKPENLEAVETLLKDHP